MYNISRRTKVCLLLLSIVLIAAIAYFFQAKIVLLVHNTIYKGRVQGALDAVNKELDYPFTLLGVRDNYGPAYKAPAICYHNEPPGVETESVGCLASIHADRRYNGEQAVAGIRLQFDAWVHELGSRLERHEWQAMQFNSSSGVMLPTSSKTVYELNKSGYHRITYEKNMHGIKCSLDVNTDDESRGGDEAAPVLFIGGSLHCGRSVANVSTIPAC